MCVDYHLHTYYSDDSEYPMEQLVKNAISKGLAEICFTDHVDYGVKDDWIDMSDTYQPEEKAKLPVMNVKYPACHAEISRLKKIYAGEITIREGMEFGMQVHTIPQYQKLFSLYPFDFIIMSCHQVEDKKVYTGYSSIRFVINAIFCILNPYCDSPFNLTLGKATLGWESQGHFFTR